MYELGQACDRGPLPFWFFPQGFSRATWENRESPSKACVSRRPSRPLVCATDGDIEVLGGDGKWLLSFLEN